MMQSNSPSFMTGKFTGLQKRHLEAAALARAANVVFLNGHRVGNLVADHAAKRGEQVAFAGGLGIVGIIRKHLEKPAAENFVAPGHGGAEISVAGREDRQIGGENQITTGHGLEDPLEIRRLNQCLHA